MITTSHSRNYGVSKQLISSKNLLLKWSIHRLHLLNLIGQNLIKFCTCSKLYQVGKAEMKLLFHVHFSLPTNPYPRSMPNSSHTLQV